MYKDPFYHTVKSTRKTQFININVQRRFTKRLPGIGHLTYRERLSALNLESLEIRRLRLDLLLTYKIMFGMTDIDSHKLFCPRANIKPTRGHGFKLVQEQFETQRRRSFFCQRVVSQCLEQFASFYSKFQ